MNGTRTKKKLKGVKMEGFVAVDAVGIFHEQPSKLQALIILLSSSKYCVIAF